MNKPIKWPGGAESAAFKLTVYQHSDAILQGKFIAIDPASLSAGVAVFSAGELVSSKTIKLPAKKPINERLNILFHELSSLDNADLLVIEKIRMKTAHIYLRWAVGTSVAGAPVLKTIEAPTTFWRAIRPEGYVKTDEGDAVLIGQMVILLAREMMT